MIDVVIPHYGPQSTLNRCLASIRKAGGPDHQVFVHDNNVHNVGFAGAINAAARLGSGPYLVLLNNDTVVPAGWLESLMSILDRDPGLAAVGPISTANTQWQGVEPVRRWLGVELPHDGFVTTTDGAFPSNLAFWCVMIRRAAWEHVGELDDGYFMYGEDDDWCLRAAELGYPLALNLGLVVQHDHRASYDEDTKRHHEVSRERFKNRWQPGSELRHWSTRLDAGEVARPPIHVCRD